MRKIERIGLQRLVGCSTWLFVRAAAVLFVSSACEPIVVGDPNDDDDDGTTKASGGKSGQDTDQMGGTASGSGGDESADGGSSPSFGGAESSSESPVSGCGLNYQTNNRDSCSQVWDCEGREMETSCKEGEDSWVCKLDHCEFDLEQFGPAAEACEFTTELCGEALEGRNRCEVDAHSFGSQSCSLSTLCRRSVTTAWDTAEGEELEFTSIERDNVRCTPGGDGAWDCTCHSGGDAPIYYEVPGQDLELKEICLQGYDICHERGKTVQADWSCANRADAGGFENDHCENARAECTRFGNLLGSDGKHEEEATTRVECGEIGDDEMAECSCVGYEGFELTFEQEASGIPCIELHAAERCGDALIEFLEQQQD